MKERFSDKTIILAGLVAGSALLLEKKIDLLFIAAVLESMLLMLMLLDKVLSLILSILLLSRS